MAAPVSTGTGAVVLKIRIFQERRLFMVKSKTMTTESTIATTEQVTYDSDMMSAELDKIQLNKSQTIKGILRLVICSAIGIAAFFVSVPHNGKSEIIFSIIYNAFVNMFGNFAYWILTLIVAGNFVCHIYFKYVKKGTLESPFAKIYDNDTIIHTFLYALGFIYVVLYACHINITGFQGPEIIIGDSTGGSVIPPIVLGVFGIIIVGAIFMPFLLNYGILEIIGAILEPLMRPLFKVPEKAALDAVSSFVSSSSLGVLITNRLWKRNVYTEKEMVAIMTGFSAVSIGFAYMVINTAKLGDHFVKVYAISFVLVFIIEMITVRIPPISKKKDVYYSGHVQTEAERKNDTKFSFSLLPLGINRAVKRAYIAKNVSVEVKNSLKDSLLVLPQVLTMLSAIGVSGLILAEYTPVFKWLGYIFQPLLVLFRIPDVSAIAPSIPVGIAEMFLPTLLVTSAPIITKFTIAVTSVSAVLFFSASIPSLLSTDIPIKMRTILLIWVERTIISLIVAAGIAHLFF